MLQRLVKMVSKIVLVKIFSVSVFHKAFVQFGNERKMRYGSVV